MRLVPKSGGRNVHVQDGDKAFPLRDMTPEDVEPLIISVGPFGPRAAMLGFHPNTYVMYFLKDSADMPAVRDTVNGVGDGVMAVFQNRRGISSPSTLDAFWRRKDAKPLTKLLAGAMQFIPIKKAGDGWKRAVYITHMSVRSKWRRNRLNWLMVEEARLGENLPVIFDDPTDMGEKFMRKYQP